MIEAQAYSPSQNGNGRKIFKKPAEIICGAIQTIRPQTTADEITRTGTALVLTGVALAEYENIKPSNHHLKNKFIAGVLMSLGFACDWLDGAYARYTKTTSEKGAITDTINDKAQESGAEIIRGASSLIQGNIIKGGLHAIAAALHGRPALERNKAEMDGYVVAESGNNWAACLGTRPARALLMFGAVIPEKYQTPLAEILVTAGVVGDIFSIKERRDYQKNGRYVENEEDRDKLQKTAQAKQFPLEGINQQAAIAGIILGAVVLDRAYRWGQRYLQKAA